MESEKYPYQKEWEEYKRRQKTYWLIFLGFIPLMILFNWLLADSSGEPFSNQNVGFLDIRFIGFAVFAVIWVICGLRLQYWKCPQCGKAFHSKWWWHNIFSSKCLHCNLPKYEGSTFYNDQLWDANR